MLYISVIFGFNISTWWLNKYKWLAYSANEKGAFCKVCVIFSPRYAGPGLQKLKTLVSQVYTRWKDALGNFNYHQQNKYHLNSCEISDALKAISMNQKISISNVLNKKKFDIVTTNRARIIIIIDAIIWLGRQGLALISHRVSAGPLTLSSSHNEGKFKELLKLLCNNNDNYIKLFESSAKNATYLSPCIQKIISICNKFILKEISTKVSPFSSVLADETSDVGNIEQLSIAIKTIAKEILASLQDLDLNLNLTRGQEYDGAPSMSGHVKGVQSRIIELYSTALYVHCSSHCLNLMISEACEIRDIRNSLQTISSVCDFFTTPKKRQLFIRTFDDIDSNNPKKKLKRFCPISKILQKINLDLREVMNRAKDIVEILTNIRENVDEKFHDIYKKRGHYLNDIDERLRDQFMVGMEIPGLERDLRALYPDGLDRDNNVLTFQFILDLALASERADKEIQIKICLLLIR
ncbi:zinc finger MYM-type protein 1-like [Gordionus sp. m RMFG-2023]|uniref:zinc finger MYM-type protein 1-like n=1 Tax=Gordionus sp. m RMFG-2023 TaxID=3053472 RepID=UPI0031FC26CF